MCRSRDFDVSGAGYALKKLWVEKEHLRWQEIRTRGELTRRRISQEKKRERNREKSGTPRLRTQRRKDILPRTEVEAPAVFSLVANPEGTISCINRVRQAGRDHHVQIRLENISALGPAAVALLLSEITQLEMAGTSVAGNYPNDAILKEILEGTGFFDHVRRPGPSGPTRKSGRMYRLGKSRQVMPQTAKELSAFAMKLLTGTEQKHGPSYALLMETMGNTFDHAARTSLEHQQWWATVYHDATRGRACFTFIDHGVGILHSFPFLQRIRHWPDVFQHNGEKLQRLLLGQIPSRTREKHRGRGLPNAYDTWVKGRVKNLVVIANNAYANAEEQAFREMAVDFSGTIVYWEI
jgi:hypothetical protein